MTTIASLNLSQNALTTLDEVGFADADVARDIERIRTGATSRDTLLEECLDGVEDGERAMAWREYADAVDLAAEVRE